MMSTCIEVAVCFPMLFLLGATIFYKLFPSEIKFMKKVPMGVKEGGCIFHKGSYETIPQSYKEVLKYIEENGYEICENTRKSYIDGAWNKESAQDWLTEIQVPVCKIQQSM